MEINRSIIKVMYNEAAEIFKVNIKLMSRFCTRNIDYQDIFEFIYYLSDQLASPSYYYVIWLDCIWYMNVHSLRGSRFLSPLSPDFYLQRHCLDDKWTDCHEISRELLDGQLLATGCRLGKAEVCFENV